VNESTQTFLTCHEINTRQTYPADGSLLAGVTSYSMDKIFDDELDLLV